MDYQTTSNGEVLIIADAAFDGERFIDERVRLHIAEGRIVGFDRDLDPRPEPAALRLGFVCPGLVDAHVHLALDGDEPDLNERKRLQSLDLAALLAIGARNLERQRAAGVTLVTDAGDRWGVNQMLRSQGQGGCLPSIRSAGHGLRAPGRYGSFFAEEVDLAAPEALVAARARRVDVLKIVQTGIIDFAGAQVKGRPQFEAAILRAIVAAAHARGLPVMAHCSGAAGISTALAADIDAIEHGFFMTPDQIRMLGEQQTSWVPTWTPVDVMRRHPELVGLDTTSVAGITRILDAHRDGLAAALADDVPVLTGTDAGSLGVPHGRSLWREMQALADAGWPRAQILRAASSRPRHMWGLGGGFLRCGAAADVAGFAHKPIADWSVLEQAALVVIGTQTWQPMQPHARVTRWADPDRSAVPVA